MTSSRDDDRADATRDAARAPLAQLEEISPLAVARGLYLQAALDGRREAALGIAREALESAPPLDVYQGIFQEALYDVGARWEHGLLNVAQEHLVTAITQYVLARIFAELPRSSQHRGGAMITGVQGELHQIGGHMVADVLHADGWETVFLGTNVPRQAIVETVERHRPTILGISATLTANLTEVSLLVEAVRAHLGSEAPAILLGGAGVVRASHTALELGVFGIGHDLADARRLAALVGDGGGPSP